jgi:hypothetical protein
MIWTTILLVLVMAPVAEAADTNRVCNEMYGTMPRRVRNYLPALILNTKDKGRDVFRIDTAVLVADKTDECTITYRYHEQGEQKPPTCSETVNYCPTSAAARAKTLLASESSEKKNDAETFNKKVWEEKEKAVRELEDEKRRKWEDEDELEDFVRVVIKYKEDDDKARVLADVKSVGGELMMDEDKRWLPRVIEVKIRRDKKKDLIRKLKTNPGIDSYWKIGGKGEWYSTTPNDQFYQYQTWAPKIGMPAAWDISIGGWGVTVAVLDTGVTYWNDLGGEGPFGVTSLTLTYRPVEKAFSKMQKRAG